MENAQSGARALVVGFVLTLGFASLLSLPAEAQLTGAVEGTVTDDSGRPLEGALVEARNVSGAKSATSGKDGTYRIDGLAHGQYDVKASKGGFAPKTVQVTITPLAATGRADFALEPLAMVLSGVVTNAESGQRLADAYVRAWSYNEFGERFEENVTDADGEFAVRFWGSSFNLEISKERFYSHYESIEASDNLSRDFALAPIPKQTARVVGRVVDEAGNGVQAFVQLRPDWEKYGNGGDVVFAEDCPANADCAAPSGNATSASMVRGAPVYDNWNSTVSAEDGRFEMWAYPGFVVVEANRRDYLVDSESLELVEGQTHTVDFRLVPAPPRSVTVKGVVIDAETREPVPGASVSLENPEWADYNYAQASEDGRFTMEARHGYTQLRANAWQYYYIMSPEGEGGREGQRDREYYTWLRTVRTTEGQTVELTIELVPKPRPDSILEGYVVDAESKQAIPGAQVYVSNEDTHDWGEASTDEHGSYRIEVRGGVHVISVSAPGHFSAQELVTVKAKETKRLDVFVQPGEAKQVGWWSPDDYGCGYGEPCPVYAEEGEAFPPTRGRSGAPAPRGGVELGIAQDESAETAADGDFESRGEATYAGSGGGLGPYKPASGEERGAPGFGALLAALGLLGALGLASRRRR